MDKKFALASVAVIAIVAGGALYWHARPAAPPPADIQAATSLPPPDCLLPGPVPTQPDGGNANAAEMAAAHDVIQGFVERLEAYQACRNDQIDHAAPNVSEDQKLTWVRQGNAAVDEANALAQAFAVQMKIFKDRTQKG